jgi:hypothetical protein
MTSVWACKPENYLSTLAIRGTTQPLHFSFELYSERAFLFQSTIPPLDILETLEISCLNLTDIEWVRIVSGQHVLWQGEGQSLYELNIPTYNQFLQVVVRYSKSFNVPPNFCWVKAVMKYGDIKDIPVQ